MRQEFAALESEARAMLGRSIDVTERLREGRPTWDGSLTLSRYRLPHLDRESSNCMKYGHLKFGCGAIASSIRSPDDCTEVNVSYIAWSLVTCNPVRARRVCLAMTRDVLLHCQCIKPRYFDDPSPRDASLSDERNGNRLQSPIRAVRYPAPVYDRTL